MALFLPYAAGLSLNQVNPVVSRMLGSFLQEGSISVLNYANRILSVLDLSKIEGTGFTPADSME